MPTLWFRIFWGVWVAVGLAFEIWAVWLDKEPGDTLSEQVWLIVQEPRNPLWWVALGLMAWASLHFLLHNKFGWM